MVSVILKMRALPEKRRELKQTLLALIEPTRNEKGCLGYDVFEDIENKNSFCLVERWASMKELDDHQRTERFAVLMGTRSLLEREPEIIVNEISHLTI